jgi:hypothetical protein
MFLDFFTTIFKNYMFKVGINKFQYSSQCEDENVDIILGLFLCLWRCKNMKFLFLCVCDKKCYEEEKNLV